MLLMSILVYTLLKENGTTYIKEVFNGMSPQRSFLRNPISTFCVPGSHEIFPSVFSMFTKKYHVINKYNQWASSDERERERRMRGDCRQMRHEWER